MFVLASAKRVVADNVFATNAKGQTALFVALKNARIGAARVLLEHVERMPEASRQNIAAADSSAARPLYMAVMLQEEDIVRRILALNYEMWNERRFALYKARELKNPAICRAIAEHHTAMPLDITPSMTMQAKLEFAPSVRALKTVQKIHANMYSSKDWSNLLDSCLSSNNAEMLQLMMSWKPEERVGMKSLSWMLHAFPLCSGKAMHQCNQIRMLVRNGYVIGGKQWVHLCAEADVKVLEYLLMMGIDVDMRDARQRSGLMRALEERSKNIGNIETLFYAGADINAKDNVGETALHKFLGSWNLNSDEAKMEQVLDMLLCDKLDIWYRDRCGYDVLEWALRLPVRRYDGLDWHKIGKQRPRDGIRLYHTGLQQVLQQRTRLDREFIRNTNFGVLSLRNYVKSGDYYFQPLPLGLQIVREYILHRKMGVFALVLLPAAPGATACLFSELPVELFKLIRGFMLEGDVCPHPSIVVA